MTEIKKSYVYRSSGRVPAWQVWGAKFNLSAVNISEGAEGHWEEGAYG
jgi:hypothetical protein